MKDETMDNFAKGLHSHAGITATTSLAMDNFRRGLHSFFVIGRKMYQLY
jgi:hypothetical protein